MQWQFWSTPRCNPSCFVHVFYGQSLQSSHSNIKYQPNLAAWFSIMMYYGSVSGAPLGPPGAQWNGWNQKNPSWGEWNLHREGLSWRPPESPERSPKKDRKVTPQMSRWSPKTPIKKLNPFKLQGDTINGYSGGNAALALPTPWGNCMELRNCTGHNSGPRTWALVLGVVWKEWLPSGKLT